MATECYMLHAIVATSVSMCNMLLLLCKDAGEAQKGIRVVFEVLHAKHKQGSLLWRLKIMAGWQMIFNIIDVMQHHQTKHGTSTWM